jgi:hypothetical protein
MNQNLWSALQQGAASGVLAGGYPFARNNWYVGELSPVFGKRVNTIQEMLDIMESGDIGFIGPGSYDEAVVTPVGLTNVALFGAGSPGSVAIVPSTANAVPLTIIGDSDNRTQGIRVVNIGCETNGTGTGLLVKGNIRRVLVQNCKLEGGSVALNLQSDAEGSVADCKLIENELCWTATALLLSVSGGGDPVTQTLVMKNLLHNYTARGLYVPTVHSADLWVLENMFNNQEDGSDPSDEYLSAAVANTTGSVVGNFFANPTNQATRLAIAAGVIWGPNGTEAGWSVARPA